MTRMDAFFHFLQNWGYAAKTMRTKGSHLQIALRILSHSNLFVPFSGSLKAAQKLIEHWRTNSESTATIERSRHDNENAMIEKGKVFLPKSTHTKGLSIYCSLTLFL